MPRSGDPFDEVERELRDPEPVRAPQLERVGAGYRLLFPESRVLIEIQRVFWHKEDAVAVYAISVVPISAADRPRRIDHGTLNLQSSRVRSSLAKELQPQHEAPWKQILDEASAKIIELETMGEDPVELQSIDVESLPPRQLLGNICVDREPTMLFGHGGDGKSYILLAAGISLVTGRALLDIKPSRVLRGVAYLDWEWRVEAHAERMRRLVGTDSVPNLWHFVCRKPLYQEVDRLAVQFRRLGIEYALIDSVAWACGGAPEESAMATAYQNALRVLDVGSLSGAHVNRKADTTMPFGSVFWHASMRATYFVKKQQAEGGEDMLSLILLNRKGNSHRLDKQIAFAMDFHDGRTTIVKTGSDALPTELRAHFPLKERIVDLLRERKTPLLVAEIAPAVGATEASVRDKVNQFRDRVFTVLKPAPGEGRAGRIALTAWPRQETNEVLPGVGASSTSVEDSSGDPSRERAPAHGETSLRNEGEDSQTRERELSTTSGLGAEAPPISKGGDATSPDQVGERGDSKDVPPGDSDPDAWSCSGCGFDEYRPVPGGRICLSCEKLDPL